MNTQKENPPCWAPPFCPNSNCKYHKALDNSWEYKKIGFFYRDHPPHRVQRFTCQTCGRSFSSQTFAQNYWQKIPDLDEKIVMKTVGCMANRQIARDLGVSPETINRRLARIGRHCLLFHQAQMRDAAPFSEIVVDGFESFEWSQYFPTHHHLAVEKETDFFIYFTDSPLRRKGRMTEPQKKRRLELENLLGRPDPKAIEKDMAELLDVSLRGQHRAIVHSDDHPAYKLSIKRLAYQIEHRITPGSDFRNRQNKLFVINLLDHLVRHSSSNHKRETIAWSKRRQASSERLAILLVWRNYMKGRREKDPRSPTPAMERGMMDRRLSVEELLAGRIFRTHVELPPRWSEYYDRVVATRALAKQRRHELKYAY